MDQIQLPKPQSESPLLANRSFWGLLLTQFLGAFNDNIYKTTLMLLFVAIPTGAIIADKPVTSDWQGRGTFLFVLPFLLFSGWAGYLSDRYGKRDIIALCKWAELLIMLLGTALFVRFGVGPMSMSWLWPLCGVLFLMGTHSAFFGPGKYGILPELFPETQLPIANGLILMTTFLAIIFGQALAGWLKESFNDNLYPIGLVCLGVAVAGIISAHLIQRTPPFKPDLRFQTDVIFIPREIRDLLWKDGILLGALVTSSLFWMAAGLVQQIVIALGKLQFLAGDWRSALMLSAVSLGIVVGAPLAGWLSRGHFQAGMLKIGAWGLAGCFALLALPGENAGQRLGYYGSVACLATGGFFAGLLSVPLQVYLQMRPPPELKGRMIATMNFTNFLGVVMAGLSYEGMSRVFAAYGIVPSYGFIAPCLLMLGVSLFYHPAVKNPNDQ